VGAVLSLRGVRHRRAGREVLRIDALDVAAGERLAVLGPNGSGKTTLLRLLAGVTAPTAGTVLIDGVPTTAGGLALRRRTAYATQRPGLLTTTVRRNVELPLRWRRLPRRRRREAAEAALGRLGVAELAERPAVALSGGEAQRVSLARALALEPELLLLDEPAAGLDADSRAAFLADAERALDDRATTVVHVSHRADEALRLADRVAVLVAGAIRQLAAPDALLGRPADATVARLVGYENLIEADVAPDGAVVVAGRAIGLTSNGVGRRVTVAAWAAAVRLAPPRTDGIPATVTRVSLGPGRREAVLEGPASLRAHLPLDGAAPSPGDSVSVRLDPALCAVVPADPS
jgi:ABC-type Fe3+/spermidine/putrescine transport system ATPase subunit